MKRLAVVLALAGSVLPAQALPICPANQPICKAAPGVSVCSLDSTRACLLTADCAPTGGTCIGGPLAIGGTAAPNGAAISTVVLTGATNLTLVAGAPGSPTYFRVLPTNPALDATGTVLATDAAAHTCTVPVSFLLRPAGAVIPSSPQTICPVAEGYSFSVTSAPSSPAGTNACSSHLATCFDTAPSVPGGYEFFSDARILSIRSPITGVGIQMELIRQGAFFADMKMLFSRSPDGGFTFTNFTDASTSTDPGSTIIRGTGQWSDVKVAAGVSLAVVPTLGEWGIVILSLLLLASSSVLFTNRRTATATGGARGGQGPALPLVDRRILVRTLGAAGSLWLLGVAAMTVLAGAPGTTDLIGSSITAGILAYQIHLWILQARR